MFSTHYVLRAIVFLYDDYNDHHELAYFLYTYSYIIFSCIELLNISKQCLVIHCHCVCLTIILTTMIFCLFCQVRRESQLVFELLFPPNIQLPSPGLVARRTEVKSLLTSLRSSILIPKNGSGLKMVCV